RGDAPQVVGVVHPDPQLEEVPPRRRHEPELLAAGGGGEPPGLALLEPEVAVERARRADVGDADRDGGEPMECHAVLLRRGPGRRGRPRPRSSCAPCGPSRPPPPRPAPGNGAGPPPSPPPRA